MEANVDVGADVNGSGGKGTQRDWREQRIEMPWEGCYKDERMSDDQASLTWMLGGSRIFDLDPRILTWLKDPSHDIDFEVYHVNLQRHRINMSWFNII
jgi:hypothetical protein